MPAPTLAQKLLSYGDKKLEALLAANADLKKIEAASPDAGTHSEWEEAFATKHNLAGQCRGLAIAIFLVYKPTWSNPDEVADFLKARYKARKAGQEMPEPPAATAVTEARAAAAKPAGRGPTSSTPLGRKAQANADAAAGKTPTNPPEAEPEPDDGSVTVPYTPPGGEPISDVGYTDRVKAALAKAAAAKAAKDGAGE